jgi:uncharacterized protein (DUF58 family)
MLTSRGWWFLLTVLGVLLVGILGPHAPLTLLALTLLLWFLGQWLLFAVRSRLVARQLVVEREVWDERGPVDTLWAGRTFTVRVRLRLRHVLTLPHVGVADWVPFGLEYLDGATAGDGPLAANRPLELDYRVRCTAAAGSVRFEGIKVQLADFQGFFFHGTFVAGVLVCRLLPAAVDYKGRAATSKRHNLLPPPGIHRMRRPGSGTELLDLRDYLPGDPPKTIAWKVSARRDRLITKEFESDVPLRCTLFVDTSNSVRVGPVGRNALGRLLHLSAAAAQANTAARDLTGLCLFDEHTATTMRPGRTPRHLAGLINRLTEAANLAPATARAPVETLLPLAHAFAEEIYPDLLRPAVNRVPFWLPWLWPMPAERARTPTGWGHGYRWVTWALSLLPFLLIAFLFALLVDLAYDNIAVLLQRQPLVPRELLFGAFVVGLLVFYPSLLVLGRAMLSRLFAPRERRLASWRKQMAALLSARYGLAPGGLALLLEDDEQCALHLQRFLAEHRVPYPLPLYDEQGRYLFAAPAKVQVLARELLRAVGKGHDNELFVLLADLLELEEQLPPLLAAVRVALARHHQVVVICPWPPGVPRPDAGGERRRARSERLRGDLATLLEEATAERFHAGYQRVRRTFARLGVPVVCAAGEEPVPLILDRMERLRMLGRKR